MRRWAIRGGRMAVTLYWVSSEHDVTRRWVKGTNHIVGQSLTRSSSISSTAR
jgi:hypothetical protein